MVRGARNIPCLEGHVGMRAAFVQQCFSGNDQAQPSDVLNIAPDSPFTGPATPERGPLSPPDEPGQKSRGLESGDSDSDSLSLLNGMGTPDSESHKTWQALLTSPLH